MGGLDGRLYLDLCDETWRAVEIDTAGWRVIDDPPVRFRRAAGMQPLAMPVPGGSVEALRSFLNVQADADFVLVVAWALACLRDRGPYPVIVLAASRDHEAGERVAKSKTWPDSPRALSGRLRRAATFLRKVGIVIDFGHEGGAGRGPARSISPLPRQKIPGRDRPHRPHRPHPHPKPIPPTTYRRCTWGR